jgi:hypothetical protein
MVKKSYTELMKEITPKQLYYGLLAHGLFSDKLPPVFSSVNFFDYCQIQAKIFDDVKSTYIFYENMREINIPRQLGIPNPISYQKLCKCLSDNWYKICEHFEKHTSFQSHKISRIHIRKLKNNQALFEMKYRNWQIDGDPEPEIMIDKRYLVKSDITKCFPSIYTHSLPWTLIGKSNAKANRSNKFWYNKIDYYTQNLRNGETHGLMIGPHTSNLLSEIILTVVDYNLLQKGWNCFIRNIDDYSCYVESYNDGQKFIIDLSDELRNFDLTINYSKNSISKLPIASTKHWIRQINAIKINKNELMNYNEIKAYLDNVIENMNDNNELSSILNYAIKVLSNQKMSKNARDYYLKTILHYATIYPYLIPLLESYVFKNYKFDDQIIRKFTNKIFNDGIQYNYIDEICFSLYYSLKYDVILSNEKKEMETILSSNNCIILLLVYLYLKKHNDKKTCKMLMSNAHKLSINDDDFGQYWLFIYELLPESKLRGVWKDMKNKGVTFLKQGVF